MNMKAPSQAGFTLIEMLVAMSLFLMVSALMAPSFVAHLSYTLGAERRTEAVAAAQQVLDELRVLDPATLPTSGTSSQNITAGQRTFQVVTTYCSDTTYCSTRSRLIGIDVSFKNEEIYHVETVFTRLQ